MSRITESQAIILAGYHNDASGMVVTTTFFDRLYWVERFLKVYADSKENPQMETVDEWGRHTRLAPKKFLAWARTKLEESGRTLEQALASTSASQINNIVNLAVDMTDVIFEWGERLFNENVSKIIIIIKEEHI